MYVVSVEHEQRSTTTQVMRQNGQFATESRTKNARGTASRRRNARRTRAVRKHTCSSSFSTNVLKKNRPVSRTRADNGNKKTFFTFRTDVDDNRYDQHHDKIGTTVFTIFQLKNAPPLPLIILFFF